MAADASGPDCAADLDEAKQRVIGVPQYVGQPGIAANERNVQAMCAAVENGNPAWWDARTALETLGDIYCPATMMPAWGRPELWQPGDSPAKALQAHFDLKDMLGYSASFAVSYTTSFYAPIRLGERLRTQQMVRKVGPLKTTKVGTGRFWTVEMQYLDDAGQMVGIESYEFFGFEKDRA